MIRLVFQKGPFDDILEEDLERVRLGQKEKLKSYSNHSEKKQSSTKWNREWLRVQTLEQDWV